MQFQIGRKDLEKLVGAVAQVADAKSHIPALAGVKLISNGETVTACATDSSIFVVVEHAEGVDFVESGATVASAKDLLGRIKAMPDGNIMLSYTDGRLCITARGSRRSFTMSALPGDDFPEMPTKKSESVLELPCSTLSGLLATVRSAACADASRSHINGILLEVSAKKIAAVATDGHRLIVESADVLSDREVEFVVPLGAYDALRSVLTGETVSITLEGERAFFETDAGVLVFSVPSGKFPPYRQVIPKKKCCAMVSVERGGLLDAVRAVGIAADSHTNGMRIGIADGSLTLQAQGASSGMASDSVEAECSATDATIGISHRYLADALSAAACDTVEMHCGGELDPVLIERQGSDGFQAVVMPMRI